ncbi:hypothetical protein BMR1_02g02835 [Babesia microti strain RI]|uniref:Uncharacterized protein n=1 Tax=Babesia microti (strain RI) TaxID=1133968 RepID=I7IGE5_BABMR|nr:hypothetical protein BMR1_02g02835 [Babesia microti strain RI]CCF73721.1 hypothetical protein BMR1_02g02835 [Babesia microti strain RI]|eukprot:XP_012648330.1 hypothetical protein BMR1_02g02835 [Babesia microti strain RI]
MNLDNDYTHLSEKAQFAAFDMLSDLIYTISELESRGSVHLSHLNNIRSEITAKFRAIKHIKSLKCCPSVYESLIDKIDLVDFLEASQRVEFDSHILQFSGQGCFAIPRIPPPPEITSEFVSAWNDFFSYKNGPSILKRGKRKKPEHDQFNPIPIDQDERNIQMTDDLSQNLHDAKDDEDIIENSTQGHTLERVGSYKLDDQQNLDLELEVRFKFDLIDNRSALLEWASTCGSNLESIKQLQNWAIKETNQSVSMGNFIKIDSTEVWKWNPPIEQSWTAGANNNLTMDIPLIGNLSSEKMCISHIVELRKLRFGPNRMNSHDTTNESAFENYNLKCDIGTVVNEKRWAFMKNMSLFYNALEGLHRVYKNLNNAALNIVDKEQKMAIEQSMAILSVFEEQYKTVFKDNILFKQFQFIDTKKMRTKKKLLALASMIIATPPCDNGILSTIHGELGSYIQYIKKSKSKKPSNLIVDMTQKSLIKRSCGEMTNTIDCVKNPVCLPVAFPTSLELVTLDLPCEIFSQHKLRVGNSLLYNTDLLLEQLITKSPLFSFTF